MGVEMDHADGSIGFVDGSEKREGDRVVTTKGDDARKSLASFADADFVGSRVWFAHKELIMPVLNLLQSVRVVVTESVSESHKVQ